LTHTPFTSTPAEPDVTEKYDCHKAMVRYMDFTVGKLIKTLDDLGIRKNTIIIYTTDNGTTGQITGRINGREVQGGKTKTTENGICEPFVVNCPGVVPGGKTTTALCDLTDILPTCADLAGASLPGNYVFDGVSLSNVFLGKTENSPREWIMAMGGDGKGSSGALSENGLENEYRFRDRVVRNKAYKLFVSSDRKPEKLISISDDPEERSDLLSNNDPKIKNEFEKLWKAASGFPEKDNDPIYKPVPKQSWDKEVTVKSQIWKK
jgi:arylsulfatase A-like enzyme